MPFLHPHRPDQLGHPLPEPLPGQAGQLGQRAADQPAHRVAAVQRRVRVLEHDLQRLELIAGAVAHVGGQRLLGELDGRARIGRDQAEQHPGQGGLAAAGLADEAERLPAPQVEVHPGERAQRRAAGGEGLRHVHQPGQRLGILRGPGQAHVHRCAPRQVRGDVVAVAAGGVPRVDRERGRRCLAAAVLGDRAARGEHAPGQRVARRRQEARDRVQPAVVLALVAARDAAQQPDRVGVPRRVEDLPGRALLDQFPGVQDPDPVAHLRDDRQVVADEQHRGGELRAQRGHQVEHLGLDGRVQRGGRLVQDQQRRLCRQRHGDRRPAAPSRRTTGAGTGP